ncbi:ribosomal protein S18-alanine N-acetyltransferase [Corynebacterium felinum]|uniref:Ribosomal-protein-alanine N-acetyltransferase n=1 Tax=Corynebacterium felinum TaxID=131318 RepID=A0ABU2B819_9CORY|nr:MULTISPECIES: ribosomal protein S18-alanine N-acetyltransferase [Corynebacterium]MDF5820999.1 ribosomal protein S18-alanine N-acetyltransferase [Corynebacterium felinum]MDO4760843.1 ribosomal protein S18-alanine N-acetyltransferase [Corynebacterium sp.]MDR7354745.1 ribosomal-protein-alanine N-acetyltransferase [Corynebacterium felinum]WJY94108.1 Mycothiol acetyltransferase [Corynebacterium felinum]
MLEIRPLDAYDAPRLAELEKILFEADSPWTERDFTEVFAQPHNFYIGVYDPESDHPEKLIGYAGLGILGPSGGHECEIQTIGVDPSCQRQGIGRMMMDNLMYVADELRAPVFLEVRTDNQPAIRMYESYGFSQVGLRKNYYQPSGADAFVMVREKKEHTPS